MSLEVSTLFFELALIFLPGFIWMKIHTAYGAKGTRSEFDKILNTFIFGVISYIILMSIYWLFDRKMNILDIDTNGTQLFNEREFPDILFAIGIAVVCGLIHLYAENYKWITRFAQYIGATKRFGDEDVWDFVFNSNSKDVEWIYYRDFDERVVYAGYVRLFSESNEVRELLLERVIVYDFEGEQLYEMPRLYLAKKSDNVHIEFPDVVERNNGE